MASYVYDTESNGFLSTLTKLHCLVLEDVDTGEVHDFADQPGYRPIKEGIAMLAKADLAIAHNGIKHDIPAINKVYPGAMPFGIDDLRRHEDTLVMSRMVWPDLKDRDASRRKKPSGAAFPGKLVGSHALEAWGHRLGLMKGEYGKDAEGKHVPGCWDEWNKEMHTYCIQDVKVTAAFYRLIRKTYGARPAFTYGADFNPTPVQLEHEFAYILAEQERRGIAFNEAAAVELYTTLVGRRQELNTELQSVFPPEVVEEVFVPKGNNKTRGYVKGVPFIKKHTIVFNPSSRQQIIRRLEAIGWKPQEFTDNGNPKVDETVLAELALRYPQTVPLNEYFLVEKRIGQIAEGDQAWLKVVRNGRIHGSVNPCGTPTARCTHSSPNVTQVPKVGKPYGKECRSLFMASTAMVLVGADLSGIELRCLAHFMSHYDAGLYAKLLLEGDVHWANVGAMGMCPDPRYKHSQFHTLMREEGAKRFIYAFLYGCGDHKAGTIIYDLILLLRQAGVKEADQLQQMFFGTHEAPTDMHFARAGKKLKGSFLRKTPALKRLREVVIEKAKQNGTLKALDGRKLHVRSAHSALNTLLQAAGALIAKLATVIAYRKLCAKYTYGVDFAQVIHAHDELQTECRPEIADDVGKIIVQSMAEAGVLFNLRLPIAGEYKIGKTWADTH